MMLSRIEKLKLEVTLLFEVKFANTKSRRGKNRSWSLNLVILKLEFDKWNVLTI